MIKSNNKIKSYVLRSGRLSKLQRTALDSLYDLHCIPYSKSKINFKNYFENKKVILEIGFGMGDSTAIIAKNNEDSAYLGIEVHKPGVGKLLSEISINNLNNIKIINHDAIEVIQNMIKNKSLDGVHIFFPDPWPKNKHNKRRLINTEFINLISKKMKKGAYIYAATDWENYGEQILKVLSSSKKFKNKYEKYAPKPDWRPLTKFEQKGLSKKHLIKNIIFIR